MRAWPRASLMAGLLLGCSDPPSADDEAGDSESESAADSTGPDGGTESESGTDSSGTSTETTETSESETDEADTTETTGELSPGCGRPSPGPGTHAGMSVDVGGMVREYELFVPSGYDPDSPAPLVLNFHGLLGTPSQQADFSQFDTTAESRGMVVAYPTGIGNSFNSGVCCGTAQSQGVDDVAFALALVEQVSNDMCIDSRRVYVTGMSNGGHMAHRLACEAADVFAASASVTGVLNFAPEDCNPSRPISMIDFHGTSDFIVSYQGGGFGFPAIEPMMQEWAVRNGCSPLSEVSFDEGDVVCRTWPGCDEGVEVSLCTVDGGGHCWPGNGSCLFGYSTTVLHASEVIADMFEAQALP
jgi:polyhydroxybutyrate depolymerase